MVFGRIVVTPTLFATTNPLTRCLRIHLPFSCFIISSIAFFLSIYQPSSQTLLPIPPAVCIPAETVQLRQPANTGVATASALPFTGVPTRLPPVSVQLGLTKSQAGKIPLSKSSQYKHPAS